MKKFLKWLSIILLAITVLCIAVIIALPLLINPNDFKDEITTAVQQQTGRVLTIDGDIRLTVFPWLGLHLGKTRLSNAPGFGQAPMLQVDSLKLGVKLLPLFRRELQIDQTAIIGLQLNLQRLANGKTNWDDLLTPTQAGGTKPAPNKTDKRVTTPLAALAIGGLLLEKANINWDDQLTKQQWQIHNLALSSGAIQWNKEFLLKLALSAQARHLQARTEIKLATHITLHQDQRVVLYGLKLAQQLWYPALPEKPLNVQVSLETADFNYNKQSLRLDKLELQNGELRLQADGRVEKILSTPEYQARVAITQFNPRQWLSTNNIHLPENLSASALKNLQAHFNLKGTSNNLAISQLDLQLDSSHLTGNISLPALAPPRYRYQLSLDKFDVDAYLPTTEKKTSNVAASPAAGAAAASQLPMPLLRSLDVKGTFNIGQLTVSNLDIHKIETELNAQKGLLRLHPLRAQLYTGTYSGDLQLNAQGAQPLLSTNEKIQGVALGPLLKDFLGNDKLHGTTNLQARLTTRGGNETTMRQQLNGTLTATLKDGYLKGIDIDYAERKLHAQIKHEPLPTKPEKPQTGFSKLDAAFQLQNGIAHTQTLTAQLPHARMQGSGDIDLVREQLNMTLNFKFSSDVQGQTGKSYAELDRVALPVHLRGPLTKPEYDIDFDAALKALLQREVNKRKADEKAKVEQNIQQEKQQIKEKLQQKADDFLKNLLNR